MPVTPEIKRRILNRLTFCYGNKAESIYPSLEALILAYQGRRSVNVPGWNEKDALLIAYGDSIVVPRNNLPLNGSSLIDLVDNHLLMVIMILTFNPTRSDALRTINIKKQESIPAGNSFINKKFHIDIL